MIAVKRSEAEFIESNLNKKLLNYFLGLSSFEKFQVLLPILAGE